MTKCDKCCCFDEDHAENADFPEGLTEEQEQEWLEEQEDYQPDRYYYWHGDIQEDYQMPEGYECLCEECYGELLNKGEIIEKYLDDHINGFLVYTDKQPEKLNPKWNDTMGWYMPIEEVAQ